MSSRKYTKDEFIKAIADSRSIRQVLIKIGLVPIGGNYVTCHRFIKRLGLDTSHFKGKGWNKGCTFAPKRPIEDYFNNKVAIQSHKLKLRLINESYFDHKCYNCQKKEWLGQPIPIELHHKDGNRTNNNLTNLIILCPNCHALTHNYRGKNKS